MSRKRTKHGKRKPSAGKTTRRQRGSSDAAAAVLPTVWMLTVGITALAELASFVGGVWATQSEDMRLAMMTAAAMYAAATVGLIVLALTALVTRTMRPSPPRSLVRTAVVVGVVPWAVLAVQHLR